MVLFRVDADAPSAHQPYGRHVYARKAFTKTEHSERSNTYIDWSKIGARSDRLCHYTSNITMLPTVSELLWLLNFCGNWTPTVPVSLCPNGCRILNGFRWSENSGPFGR